MHTELLTVVEHLSEEDLTAFNRFDWSPDGDPLSIHIMGNMQHNQGHLVQYAIEHGKLELAVETAERWAKTVLEAGVPETLQGFMLYNLACFYATHNQGEKAWVLCSNRSRCILFSKNLRSLIPIWSSYTSHPRKRAKALSPGKKERRKRHLRRWGNPSALAS